MTMVTPSRQLAGPRGASLSPLLGGALRSSTPPKAHPPPSAMTENLSSSSVLTGGLGSAAALSAAAFAAGVGPLLALAAGQGLTLVHGRAQLEHIRYTFMGQVGLCGAQRQLKLS
jgi:hypothetical protein